LTTLTRCLCGHGPSRHYHLSGSTACRVCSCHTLRLRCAALVYARATYPVPPSQCTRSAGESGYCKQHAEA